jgi:hypothetical protein
MQLVPNCKRILHLPSQVSQLESKLSSQEAEAASKLKELVEASEGQQAAALQKQVRAGARNLGVDTSGIAYNVVHLHL